MVNENRHSCIRQDKNNRDIKPRVSGHKPTANCWGLGKNVPHGQVILQLSIIGIIHPFSEATGTQKCQRHDPRLDGPWI